MKTTTWLWTRELVRALTVVTYIMSPYAGAATFRLQEAVTQ